MKNFLFRLLIFFILIVSVNYLIVYVFEIPKRILSNNGIEHIQQKWKNLKSNEFEILILGSSRAYKSYNISMCRLC